MWPDWWMIALGLLSAFVVIWLVLAATFWLLRPKAKLQDLVRLLPDVLRLLKRLAADRELPRRIRVVLVALIAFVVSPIDLIPDAIPVIGFADDVVIVGLVLRWISRVAGPDALARHWPGTPDGLATLCWLCGLPDPALE
ncbi:YkvA family protein [Mycobacterium sp. HNNTM2301]|uniref:YkvA family protein n=1 Tax=Mycobacterium hainanense TaxID=3289775 RepID=UPI0035A5D189